ncbi:MAG: DUF3253 domain-containing protein [Pseudomonadota bacterium]
MSDKPAQKLWPVCGRYFSWRRKWDRDWDEVIYCSKRCRRRRNRPLDRCLEEAILQALAKRDRDTSICPSEAARLAADDCEQPWRELMSPCRDAARRLAARGTIEILQGGHPIDAHLAKGPIRLRLK